MTMPPTERTRNAPRFSPTALIETVAMAEMTRKSRAQPWMRSIICGSMTWETPSAFAISWRMTPPISAMGNSGTYEKISRGVFSPIMMEA